MKRLLATAVLAVAFSASLPAQNTGTVGTPASFKDEAKAELAVELIKKYEGLHDRSDYPYYGYGHCKLPGEELSYDMTEAEAEKLLIRDLEKRYRLFSKYGKGSILLSEISDKSSESTPNLRNMATNLRRSFRKSSSASRFVMVRAEYFSFGKSL